MKLPLFVDVRHGFGFQHIVRSLTRTHDDDSFVPFVLVRIRAVERDFANADAIGIDRVDLVAPIAPARHFIDVGKLIPIAHQRVAPMDDHTGIAALDDPHMREAALFVGHRLLAAVDAGRFVELVGIPDSVFRDPVRYIAGAAPENQSTRRAVESDDYVGGRANVTTGRPKRRSI